MFSDTEGEPIEVTVTESSTWLSCSNVTRICSGNPVNADVGTVTVTLTAKDNHTDTGTTTHNFYLTVTTNTPPTVANAITDPA